MSTHPLPTPLEWRRFAADLLQGAGLAGLGAGVIFFIAANWEIWGLFGRFALLGTGVLVCAALALWQPPPQRIGQGALLIATLITGAVLALFGQTYQTGADVHELFFGWSALALPFAFAAVSGAVWATWWIVLNVGLGLLCGTLGLDHGFWRFIEVWGFGRAGVLMLPCLVNLLGAALFLALQTTRWHAAAPGWLTRLLLTLGLGYGSTAAISAVLSRAQGVGAIALYAALSIGIALGTWQRRRDAFALTVLAGSWIAISTVSLAHILSSSHGGDSIGTFFVISIWLVASSTAASIGLLHCHRNWNANATGSQGSRA